MFKRINGDDIEIVMKNKNFIQSFYILCLSLSLPLHVLNMGGEEGLKLFHITAALSLVLSFFVVPRKGKLFEKLASFLLIALFSSLISFSSTAIPGWLKIFVVIYSCYGLAFVDLNKLSKWLLIFLPIDLTLLLVLAISEPQYRFQGYYNDPNYLCMTLLASSISYEDYIDILNNSKVVIDMPYSNQCGLTMRTIEALSKGIKIITTNKNIIEYKDIPKELYLVLNENTDDDTIIRFLKEEKGNTCIPESYSCREALKEMLD